MRCRATAGLLLALVMGSLAAEELALEVAAARLWFPPNGHAVPTFSDGVLTVSLAPAMGRPMALVNVPVPEGLEEDADYLLSFEVACSQTMPLIVVVPEAKFDGSLDVKTGRNVANSHWQSHDTRFSLRRIEFTYSPQTTVGTKIQLFWPGQHLTTSSVWRFRNVTLIKL
ncbi:MAG: hypothetical protein PF961_19890 [Planctomycetota bacterium]|jgi:hypothetical protein|nr:hypothetical protein [Planctomycetota bacterium]